MRTYEETLDLMNSFADGVVHLNKMSDSDLSNIITALEKQIPKKIGEEYTCGNCCSEIPRWDTNYCPECGHKVEHQKRRYQLLEKENEYDGESTTHKLKLDGLAIALVDQTKFFKNYVI